MLKYPELYADFRFEGKVKENAPEKRDSRQSAFP
jgi:hypothetical protein